MLPGFRTFFKIFLFFFIYLVLFCKENKIDIYYYNLELSKMVKNNNNNCYIIKSNDEKKYSYIDFFKDYFKDFENFYKIYKDFLENFEDYKKNTIKDFFLPGKIGLDIYYNKDEKKLEYKINYVYQTYFDVEKIIKGEVHE